MQSDKISATPEYMVASSLRTAALLVSELRHSKKNWAYPWVTISIQGSTQNTMALKLLTQERSGIPVPVDREVSQGKLRSFDSLRLELLFRNQSVGSFLYEDYDERMENLNDIRNKFVHPREDGSVEYHADYLTNVCLLNLEAIEYVAFFDQPIDWGPEITAEEVRSLIYQMRDDLFAIKYEIRKAEQKPAPAT